MQHLRRTVIAGCLLVSVQCSDAIAPATDVSPPVVPPSATVSGRIAFTTEVSNAGGYVYVANADGSGLRQLPGAQGFYTRPRWSPDRRHLLVARWQPETSTSSIFVIDVDGQSGFVKVANGHNPAWSPDGNKIVFSSAGASWPDFGIHVMDADGRNVKRLTHANDPAQCRDGSSAGDLKPDWSPDGRKIVFERQFFTDDGGYDCGLDGWGYIPNVYTMNADGTDVRRLRTAEKTRSDSDPAWSPDGRFIAYAIPFDGLYVSDSEGSGAPRRISLQNLNVGFPLSPAWAPDGKRLLFLGVQPPNNRLAVVDLESGSAHLITLGAAPGLLLDPAWSR